jgi:hypothetical protein
MAKEKNLKKALEGVRNTTVLIEKFIKFIKDQPESNIDSSIIEFKKLYESKPFYDDIKNPILSEVEALGMDVDHINDLL